MFTAEEAAARFRVQAAPVLQGDQLEKAIDTLMHIEDTEDVALIGCFLGTGE